MVLAPFCTLFRNTYSSVLDAVQLFYLFSIVLAPDIDVFSHNLDYSWLTFMPNFLMYCSAGDFSCSYGFLLSSLICWIVLSLLAYLFFLLIQKIKPIKLKYRHFYAFFRGVFRWMFSPLLFYSAVVLIKRLQGDEITQGLAGSIIVLGVLIMILCF